MTPFQAKSGDNTRTDVLAATIAAACGVLLFGGLSLLATPTGFEARTHDLATEINQTKVLSFGAGSPHAYARNPICHMPPDEAVAGLQQQLSRDASLAKVSLSNVSVTSGREGSGLASIEIRFEASGVYDGVLLLLSMLAAAKPQIFVDTADLRPRISVVDLSLRGRVYCSTSAHL